MPNPTAATAEALFADTVTALTERGYGRIALLGFTEISVALYGILANAGLADRIAVILDPRPERHGLTLGHHTVSPLASANNDPIDLLVVCADADKEDLLAAFVQESRALPEVVLAGSAHFAFRDPHFASLTEKKLVKSTATGSPNTLIHLFQCLRHAARVGARGAIAEFGMYKGGTTVILAKMAADLGLESKVIGFDAFTGFPPRRSLLDLYADPVCEFTNLDEVKRYCDPYGIEIVPGDISETHRRLENEPLLLTFFDTDNYSPTRAALPLCIQQTVPGGSIVFDHVYSLDEFRYTLGERMAAYELLGESGFFHLHGTGAFTRTQLTRLFDNRRRLMDLPLMPALSHAATRLAATSASVSAYCDHAEHLEETDRSSISAAGAELRALAVELAAEHELDLVQAYRRRLESVEQRHPLYPAGFAAIEAIPDQDATWQLLQGVQWDHDRHYHPDVLGLSRYEQLRHYAFHLGKLAGAASQTANGDPDDFIERRLPDLLIFGLKLATLVNDRLPEEPVA